MATKNKTPRSVAVPGDGTGTARYEVLRCGAEQAALAFAAGCCVESIMLTEGMLWCRVASRYHYMVRKTAAVEQPLMQLTQELEKVEVGPNGIAFREVLGRIRPWLQAFRNPMAHAAAKLIDKTEADFAGRMQQARTGALAGFQILVDLDTLDLRSRLRSGWKVDDPESKVRPPASHPGAFDSIRAIVSAPSGRQVAAGR